MKKKFLASILMLTLVCSVSLTSCSYMLRSIGGDSAGGDESEYLTRAEVEEMLGTVTTQEGNSNYIDINVEGDNGVISASKSVLSTVSIVCDFEVYYTVGWGPNAYTRTEEAQSAGSGVIYRLDKSSGDAYVITNYHVVYESSSVTEDGICDDINLYLYGQEYEQYAIPATYVGGSMSYDLAVLKVEGSSVLKASNAMAVELADSNDVSLLETVIVIGNPNGYGISATAGYINVDSEYISLYGADGVTKITVRVMRTNAPINSGNSGGGMFDSEGKLLGIVNAKIVDSSTDNIGYAIPSNIVKYITENILYYCDGKDSKSVHRCLLGITPETVASRTEYNAETAEVRKLETVAIGELSETSVVKDVLAVGDIINSITIDGVKYDVERLFNVIDCMLNARVGSTVVMNITRDGVTSDVTITITEETLTKVI